MTSGIFANNTLHSVVVTGKLDHNIFANNTLYWPRGNEIRMQNASRGIAVWSINLGQRMKPSVSPVSQKWSTWFMNHATNFFTQGQAYGMMGYMTARYVGWIVVTTGMITLLPLMLEIKREAFVEELEAMQINDAVSKGATPQELANAGMSSAVDPKVLNG